MAKKDNTQGTNPDDPKKKLNAQGKPRVVPEAPTDPLTGKPITGRQSYLNAEAFYGPMRQRLEQVFGSRDAVFKNINPELRTTLYGRTVNNNPYYDFYDPNLQTDPTADQSYMYDAQGNIVMGKITSGPNKGKDIAMTRTSIEGRRYVPRMNDVMKSMQEDIINLSDEELRKVASQNFLDKSGKFIGIDNIIMPSTVGFWDKARYTGSIFSNLAQGYTYDNGGPIVTRATTDASGNIIPMVNLPEINITSTPTGKAELAKFAAMGPAGNVIGKPSQNAGTIYNSDDKPWYSGVANVYEQAKRNQAVQALGVGAAGAGAIMGGAAAAPYVTAALPYVNPALYTPIAGVPGATTANLLGAYGMASAAKHGVRAGQKAYAGAPASEVGYEVAQGIGNTITPGYKALGPAAKVIWKGVGEPTVDTFYNTGQTVVDSIGNSQLGTYESGSYVVRRSDDRKGKTHVVIGPGGIKKYFGDPSMGERENSEHGKEAFYARHKKNLDSNPYFRAYAKATWGDGGMTYGLGSHVVHGGPRWLDIYESGAMIKRADGSYSQRGLWDNIRANKGSGKKPTKEMLAQEKKIRAAEKKADGGPVITAYYPQADQVHIAPEDKGDPAIMQHELFHRYQNMVQDSLRLPQYYQGPIRRPSAAHASESDIVGDYYNRRNVDTEMMANDFYGNPANASFQVIPQQLIYDKVLNPMLYATPWTAEGEAQRFEDAYRSGEVTDSYLKPLAYKYGAKVTDNYKKVRSSVPRVSYEAPSNMASGPWSQRGVTFVDGGQVYSNNNWLDSL